MAVPQTRGSRISLAGSCGLPALFCIINAAVSLLFLKKYFSLLEALSVMSACDLRGRGGHQQRALLPVGGGGSTCV